jgi:peptide/nickel transport system substrate-binding protein
MGVGAVLDAFSIAGSSNTGGGRLGFIEIHSQAMFTSDKTTGRPIPRLLSEQPSLDNGGLRLTDDGRMIATYKVRPDVKWADGVPLTARDLVFTYEMLQERSLPFIDIGPSTLMQSAEAPDDTTFIITWKLPYYMADAIGLRAFWPMPAHLLQADFNTLVVEQRDTASFLAKPYWTTAYVHVGPFKLVQFTPGEDVVFEAIPGYFLGRPKVDRIIVRQIADPTTMFAEIIAGSIDLASDNVLSGEQARDLKARWDASNGGRVYIGTGTTQFYAFQFDASVPSYNTAIQNKLARRALYHAIDRDSYSEVIVGFSGRAADALLPPDDTLYSYVRDGYKNAYPYDQGRAVATFEQAGWRRGGDGLLANAAGEHVKMTTRISLGSQRQGTTVSDMWRQVGVDSEIVAVPAARTTDREFLQSFPGGEIVGRGSRDSVLTRLECAEMPTPQNAFAGNNRGHWCNQDYDRLVNQYRTDLTEAGRGRTIAQISNLTVDELPLLLLNVNTAVVFARTGVTAFTDDFAGGSEAGRIYGTYSRNAHEWDLHQ